jgi:alpha-tubulin suppressor-like RCC1 family protein
LQALDANEYRTCSLLEDGGVTCWGDVNYGDYQPPAGHFIALSVGLDHVCAVRASGQVACWGNPTSIATPPPAGPYVAISAGNAESCGVRTDGQLRCWGGSLADTMPAGNAFTDLSIGDGRACAIQADGGLRCWTAPGYPSLGTTPSGRFQQVAMGYNHACALRSDGSIACWGGNANGQSSAPATGTFVAIAAGRNFSCALRIDGSITCWGDNALGQLAAPAGKYTALAIGRAHGCARDEEGAPRCWGDPGPGKGSVPEPNWGYHAVFAGRGFGCSLAYDGDAACAGVTGALAPPSRKYRTLAFGETRACGIALDGKLLCWGDALPAPPDGVFRSVAVGAAHACALREDDHRVFCWGDNTYGQSTPPAGSFEQIYAGNRFSCALNAGGHLSCWGQGPAVTMMPTVFFYEVSASGGNVCGRDESGYTQCWGDDAAALQTTTRGLLQVAVGAHHACASGGGQILCWGDNSHGQGQPPAGSDYYHLSAQGDTTCAYNNDGMVCWGEASAVRKSPGLRNGAPAITAGEAHACALRGNRRLGCWGDDAFMQARPPLQRFQSLAVGADHGCALAADGLASCWGDGSHDGNAVPAEALRSLEVGQYNGCGIAAAGDVRCWGWNVNGQGMPPAGVFRAVATGLNHSCGLRDDGTLACWGYDADGQTAAPAGVFKAVDVGERHSCAIAQSGALQCWGLGTEGQTTPPDLGGAPYRALAVGAFHNCALLGNGRIACWGRNDQGQATPPEDGLYVAIAAGTAHSCAVREDGASVCWGANGRGQAPQVAIAASSLAPVTNGVAAAVDFTMTGTGGYVPTSATYRITSGTLPYGLYFDDFGRVRGTPAGTPGTYPLQIEAVDGNGFRTVLAYTMVLNRAPDVSPPSIVLYVNGSDPVANNWYNTDVRVEWIVRDFESPVTTSGCDVTNIVQDTDGITLTCTATSEGGTNTRSVVIRRDTVAPDTAFDGPQGTAFYGSPSSYYAIVHFTFAAISDAGSGPASAPGNYVCQIDNGEKFPCNTPFDFALDYSAQLRRISVRAKDVAGNVDPTPAVQEFYVRADTTRPVLVPTFTGPLGDNDWYVGDVQLRWSVTDPETPITIKDGCVDLDITTDVGDRFSYCRAVSAAGETVLYAPYKRDATPPSFGAYATTAANAAGWYRQDVSIAYTCADATSGIAGTCPANDVISQEGRARMSPVRTVRDKAGNSTTANTVLVNLDKTPPQVSHAPRTPPNGYGWYRDDVVVDFTCSDALSGLVRDCASSIRVTAEGLSVPGETVYDQAGNSAFTGGTSINIDRTPPNVIAYASAQPNAAGWYNGNVYVVFACDDALSGLATACPSTQVLSQEGTGIASVAMTVTDKAGNTSAPSAVISANIDRTAPQLTVTMPAAQVLLNATHDFNLSASDALSGVASQSCSGFSTATLGTRRSRNRSPARRRRTSCARRNRCRSSGSWSMPTARRSPMPSSARPTSCRSPARMRASRWRRPRRAKRTASST